MGTGPIIIGYDGSPSSKRAIDEAGALLSRHEALVVVVWEAGLGTALVDVPEIPPAPIDIRAALEIDKSLYDRARRLAQQGAQLAEKAGLEAEPLVVADVVTVAETLVRLAKERDAQAIASGTDGIGLTDVLHGGTAREGVDVDIAEQHVQATFRALRKALPPDELLRLAADLPEDLRALLDDVPVVSAEEFLGQVAERTGLDVAGAARATVAVLETLAERIAGGDVHDLISRMPAQLHGPLKRGEAQSG